MMDYQPPSWAWPYVIAAAVLLLLFLCLARRGGWPALLIVLAVQSPPDPQLRAAFDSPISAVISWTQQGRGCLYRNQTFIACYAQPGAYRVTLGGSETDGAFRPTAGDTFVLVTNGGTWRAPLKWWRYLPTLRSP